MLKRPEKEEINLPLTHALWSWLAYKLFMIDLRRSGDWLRWSLELISHALQTTNQWVLNLAVIPLLEKLRSLLVVCLPSFHHLTRNDEHSVSNGQCRSFAPSAFFQTARALSQVGAASTHPMSRLYQHLSHIPMALLTCATQSLPCAFLVPWADSSEGD
jgi:hypothetical protein